MQPQHAGRGALAIAVAKLYFMLTSYAVLLSLPRIFEGPEQFGLFAIVLAATTLITNVLVVGTTQTLSRFVSAAPNDTPSIVRQGLKIHFVIACGLGAALYLGAPAFGMLVLDAEAGQLLRICALVVFSLALYGVYVGTLNGSRAFSKQAGLDITFSTIRSIAIIGGALLGFGALGAISGYAFAACAILCVALFWIGLGRQGPRIKLKHWFALLIPIALYQISVNALLQIDVQVLKRSLTEIALNGGRLIDDAIAYANHQVGVYRAAQTFAFIPYHFTLAASFVLFPLISHATSQGDQESATQAIRTALRATFLILLGIAAPIAGGAQSILALVYPPAYLEGSAALALLVFGVAAFALFVQCATVMVSSHRPLFAAAFATIATCAMIALVRTLLMLAPPNMDLLWLCALGTSTAMILAMLASLFYVAKRHKSAIPIMTLVRATFAALCSFVISSFAKDQSIASALVILTLGTLSYPTLLWLLREVDRKDLKLLLNFD